MVTKLSVREKLFLNWQWFIISRKLGIAFDRQELKRLFSWYDEPHRHYHTIRHILDCMRFVDVHFKYVPDLWQVKLALFYHDCVYNPAAKDNEVQSADCFKSWAADHSLDSDVKDKIVDMIMMTVGHHISRDSSILMKVMNDADMHIFLCPDHHYLEYARNIWREYGSVFDADAYCAGRRHFLQGLDVKTMFHMHQLRPFLKHARANIELELDILETCRDKILVP